MVCYTQWSEEYLGLTYNGKCFANNCSVVILFVILCKMDRFKQRFQSSPSCSTQSADEQQQQKETKVAISMTKSETLWCILLKKQLGTQKPLLK